MRNMTCNLFICTSETCIRFQGVSEYRKLVPNHLEHPQNCGFILFSWKLRLKWGGGSFWDNASFPPTYQLFILGPLPPLMVQEETAQPGWRWLPWVSSTFLFSWLNSVLVCLDFLHSDLHSSTVVAWKPAGVESEINTFLNTLYVLYFGTLLISSSWPNLFSQVCFNWLKQFLQLPSIYLDYSTWSDLFYVTILRVERWKRLEIKQTFHCSDVVRNI